VTPNAFSNGKLRSRRRSKFSDFLKLLFFNLIRSICTHNRLSRGIILLQRWLLTSPFGCTPFLTVSIHFRYIRSHNAHRLTHGNPYPCRTSRILSSVSVPPSSVTLGKHNEAVEKRQPIHFFQITCSYVKFPQVTQANQSPSTSKNRPIYRSKINQNRALKIPVSNSTASTPA
jgi:hypothetical protein